MRPERVTAGCSGKSSLAMAPATVLAQRRDFVALVDRSIGYRHRYGFEYASGLVARPHQPLLWG